MAQWQSARFAREGQVRIAAIALTAACALGIWVIASERSYGNPKYDCATCTTTACVGGTMCANIASARSRCVQSDLENCDPQNDQCGRFFTQFVFPCWINSGGRGGVWCLIHT